MFGQDVQLFMFLFKMRFTFPSHLARQGFQWTRWTHPRWLKMLRVTPYLNNLIDLAYSTVQAYVHTERRNELFSGLRGLGI